MLHFGLILHVNIEKCEREKIWSTMGVGQWTALLMAHEFRTTPSKLDCVLPTLHPKHSNAQGAIIRLDGGESAQV